MNRKQLKILISVLVFIIIMIALTFIYYFGNNIYESKKAGVIELNDRNFEKEVLKSDKPVLVEFYSNLCFPCIQMFSVITDFAQNNKDIKVGKVNVYNKDAKRLVKSFNISATPMMLVFKNGSVTNYVVGYQTEKKLNKLIKIDKYKED